MEDKFNITLKVAGASIFPIIDRADEEIYRQAERDLNKLIVKLRSDWRATDKEYLAMAALLMTADGVKRRMEGRVNDEVDALVEIEKRLTDHLLKVESAERGGEEK